MTVIRKLLNRTFKGIDLNRPAEKLSPDEFQMDLNGDRRRTNAWRGRVGYGRLLSGSPAPVFTATFTDDFNRADAPDLGANWTDVGCLLSRSKIVSNRVETSPIGGAQSAAYYSAGSFGTDQASQVKIATVGAAGDSPPGVIVRAGATTAYLLAIDPSNFTLRLYRVTAWGTCTFGSGSVVILDEYTTYGVAPILKAGDFLRLHVNGTLLQGYVNGSRLVSATDANIAAGIPGIYWAGGAITGSPWKLDDWGGGVSALGSQSISVNGRPTRLVAFERDDDAVKLVTAYAESVDEFDTGAPEGAV